MKESGNDIMNPEEGDRHPAQQRRRSSSRGAARRIVRALLVALACVVGLIGLLLGGVALVLTPSRLTPLVNEYGSRYLNAEVRFDTVTLSLLRHFPNVGVRLSRGEIISKAFDGMPDSLRSQVPARADTLLRFDEFTLVLNLPQLLASRLAIRRIDLSRPEAYAYVAPSGKANWEIFATDTTASADTVPGGDLFVHVVRLTVRGGGQVVYDSRPDKVSARIGLDHLQLRGLPRHAYRVDFGIRAGLRTDTVRWCDSLPLTLRGGFAFDTGQRGGILLDKLTFGIDGIPVEFDGRVDLAADSIRSDLSCRIGALPLNRLIALAPRQLMPRIAEIDTDIEVGLDTKITGSYGYSNGRLPDVTLDVKTDGGHLGFRSSKARIDRLALDATLCYRPSRPDSTGVVLRRFAVEGSGIGLDGNAAVWNVPSDPAVRFRMTGSVDLDTLSVLFPSQRGIDVRGRLGIDAGAAFRMSELDLKRVGKVRAGGRVTLDGLRVDMPSDSLSAMADGTTITFGAGHSSDSLIGEDAEMLGMKLETDTLNVSMAGGIRFAASGASLGARSAASTLSGDTTVVHPLTGEISARYFGMSGPDSSAFGLVGVESGFSIVPSPKDAAVPLLRLGFDSRLLFLREDVNRYMLAGSHVDLSATLSGGRADSARRGRLLDSLQRIYPAVHRDSLMAEWRKTRTNTRRDDFAGSDLDITLDKSVGDLLRRWDASGSVRAESGRVVTPYFPLANALRRVDISFTTNDIRFKDTQISSGRSVLELTGSISNLRRALLGRGALKADMRVEADTLDFNELVHAATAGGRFAETSQEYRQSLAGAESDEHLQQLIEQGSGAADTAGSPLIVIPSNVDMRVELCAHHGIYSDLQLNTLYGEVIVRDRCLQLRDLKAVTNAGDMKLTALYATRSRDDIVTGFDLELDRVHVDRLISVIPSVDTLLPMLRSFEGVVDCKMAATAAVDTMMNLVLPTLNAACSIRGENLVLLDGETFAEIAKMMHFKNRKRNLIDRISVDLLVRDNQIEMFPFVVEMDRYKAAVSGVHKLDMSFDYHISVLHSPIPFRLGVNIFGTLDKFKFRIGRARYKSENVPTFVDLIDTTRINLRRTITDIFRKGVEAASLSEMKIVPRIDSSALVVPEEKLTLSDSLLLQREGVLPDSAVRDSTVFAPASGEEPVTPAPADTTAAAAARPLSRKELRAQKRARAQGDRKKMPVENR